MHKNSSTSRNLRESSRRCPINRLAEVVVVVVENVIKGVVEGVIEFMVVVANQFLIFSVAGNESRIELTALISQCHSTQMR